MVHVIELHVCRKFLLVSTVFCNFRDTAVARTAFHCSYTVMERALLKPLYVNKGKPAILVTIPYTVM